MTKVLITGVQGLLGRSLSSILLDQGFDITGIARTSGEYPVAGMDVRILDLSSNWSADDLPKQCDIVIHLAQSAHFRDFPNSALDVFNVNIASTARLLDYARKVGAKKFIYASSGGVYGNGSQAFTENAPIVPAGQLGYYLGSKACSEIMVQSYASVFQVVVIRPFFMYGPGQNRSMLIPRLYDSVLNKKPITLQGDYGIKINPIHVNDAAKAVAAALNTTESKIYNIAGPDVLTIRDIAEGVAETSGIKPVFQYVSGEPNDLIGDNSLMTEHLSAPSIKLLENIADISDA